MGGRVLTLLNLNSVAEKDLMRGRRPKQGSMQVDHCKCQALFGCGASLQMYKQRSSTLLSLMEYSPAVCVSVYL